MQACSSRPVYFPCRSNFFESVPRWLLLFVDCNKRVCWLPSRHHQQYSRPNLCFRLSALSSGQLREKCRQCDVQNVSVESSFECWSKHLHCFLRCWLISSFRHYLSSMPCWNIPAFFQQCLFCCRLLALSSWFHFASLCHCLFALLCRLVQ